jgi:putative proteasome-type protease
MTYCVGLLLDDGLVMASDSRTNAGVDYISSYSKLHVFQPALDRLFVVLAAGSLATTREVLDRIHRDLDQTVNPRPSPYQQAPGPTLLSVNYLFEAATYIGQLNLAVQNEHGPALRQSGNSAEAVFILGGQIAGEAPGLFLVYAGHRAVQPHRGPAVRAGRLSPRQPSTVGETEARRGFPRAPDARQQLA